MAISWNKHDPSKTRMTEHELWWEIRTEPRKLLHNLNKRREIKADFDEIYEYIKKVEMLENAISALHW